MNNSFHSQSISTLFVIILILCFYGCKKEDDTQKASPKYEQGEINKMENIGFFTQNDIQNFLDSQNIQAPFVLSYDVKVISVEYYTVDNNGELIITSGAFLIPQEVANLPLLSIQHGTVAKRDNVASVFPTNSTSGIVGLITASMGYLTIIPDYPGFGVSKISHPYIHGESLIPSVIDFIRAALYYCSEKQVTLNDQLFLTGYSEGGYVSLLTQKEIEENYKGEFHLTAVAPLSGPYDLKGSCDTIFSSNDYSSPAYVAWILTAYNEIYNWNKLDEMFQYPYSSIMPSLFDGSNTWGEIVNSLPSTFSTLMKSDFVDSYNNGSEVELINAFEENTILNWSPQSPIHFFHGDSDNIVPYYNVTTAITKLNSNDIQLTPIPGGTHETAGPAAIFGAIEWFETFR